MNVNLNIQPGEGLYYYYHNWRANLENKIHHATCRFCVYGTGRIHQLPVVRGENGVWIGPFSSLQLCMDYVQNELHLPPTTCQVCI